VVVNLVLSFAYYLAPLVLGLIVGLLATWLVVIFLGIVGRVLMVIIVPMSFFGVWPLARALGPNGACDYDCPGNAFFGVTLFSGLVLGVAIAAVTTLFVRRT
jgi:hypothetical protein